jgi:mannose-6-phosphate isomerase-like protein (cupin superfamily)
MNESSFLSGQVRKQPLPSLESLAEADHASLKRLLLPQGELALFHNGDPAVHYLAFIELRQGTVRGNHYHKAKQEFIYVLGGEVLLVLEDIHSKLRQNVTLQTGDLVVIEPGVAHALRVRQSGQAIEFSPARFDAADIYRYPLGES